MKRELKYYKTQIKHNFIIIALFLLCLWLVSCRSAQESVSDNNNGTKTSIQVNLAGLSNDEAEKQASVRQNEINTETLRKQIAYIDDDFYAEATLEPVRKNISTTASSQINPLAIGPQEQFDNLGTGIRYKVVVFDSNGKYVTEQDYSSGTQGSDIIGLNGDATYTFIAYTIGSKTSLPIVTYSDVNNKTLSSASVKATGDDDLMYFSTTMKVSGETKAKNVLSITLKRKFARILLRIDATSTNYNIYKVNNVTINEHNLNASMNLENGNVTSSQATTRSVDFPSTIPDNTSVLDASSSVMVNTNRTNQGTITIKTYAMQVKSFASGYSGSIITHSDLVFSNNLLAPGDYILRIKVNPTDKTLVYKNYEAVRLNGMVWMRYNLGVANQNPTTNNPDVANSNDQLTGYFYQWGSPAAFNKTGTTSVNNKGNWRTTTTLVANSWNTGTDVEPVKNTTNDPCPNGWRVPSREDWAVIIKNTNYYNYAKDANGNATFESKLFPGIKLAFPFTGLRDNNGNYLEYEGSNQADKSGFFFTSTLNTSNNAWYYRSIGYATLYANSGTQNRGMTIRCIAEYPITK